MTPKEKEKIFHIYAKDKCIFHSIKEEEFSVTWNTLKGIVGLMQTDYELEDLSYEECVRAHGVGAANTTEPEGCDSY